MLSRAPRALVDELRQKEDRLVDAMLATTEPPPGQSEDDRRQFVVGYLNLVVRAAEGDLSLRDAYLETVVPGIKESGMPLPYILAQMAGVAMGVAHVVAPEHLAWHGEFTRDYVEQLMAHWSRS